jgi:hypothetical protein
MLLWLVIMPIFTGFIVWDEYNRKLATNRLYIQLPHDHDDPIIMCIKYLYLDTYEKIIIVYANYNLH